MLDFTPGALYRFRMLTRRIDGSGGAISGPSFANRDQSALDSQWRPLSHVFRATDAKGNHVVRVGQWQAAGSMQFDDVRVTPVMPIHSSVGGILLGEGESLAEGRYHFEGTFDHEGSNFHRALVAADAHFNSNRWSFGGKTQITYRFAVPGHRFQSGHAGFNVNYGKGACQAEVSRDQKQWLPLATQRGQGSIEADLPAALLPAETIFLRLSPAAPGEGFQVSRVEFHAALDGTVPEGRGRTLFADLPSHDAAGMIEAITFDEKTKTGEGTHPHHREERTEQTGDRGDDYRAGPGRAVRLPRPCSSKWRRPAARLRLARSSDPSDPSRSEPPLAATDARPRRVARHGNGRLRARLLSNRLRPADRWCRRNNRHLVVRRDPQDSAIPGSTNRLVARGWAFGGEERSRGRCRSSLRPKEPLVGLTAAASVLAGP